MKPTTVDEYVKLTVPPEFRPLVTKIRRLMKAYANVAPEAFSYGMPLYSGPDNGAYIIAGKSGVTLGFTQGKLMQDRFGLLRGSAKWARHLKLKSVDDIDEKTLAYYMKQVVTPRSK